jgi:hypothetical protein
MTMKRAAIIAILALTGCKGEGKKAEPGTGTGTGTGSGKGSGKVRVDPADVVKKDALAFLGKWTEAQVKLDFAAYAALYEPREFKGVKRTANGKVKSFDFAGWKADREKMFGRKFEIATEPLGVETWLDKGSKLKGGVAAVRFVQRWKSGTYADHGTKVLHLWKAPDGAMRIVYEDLLNSEKGWDRTAADVPVADLAAPTGSAQALALWEKLAPTGADYHEKLASIPADPKVRAPMALALLAGEDFQCEKVVSYEACGMDQTEWADFDPKSKFADPCLRRRLALWALPELAGADAEKVEEVLLAMIAMEVPETELQLAALAALTRAPEPVRLRGYKAAMAAELEEKIDVAGLSEKGLIEAATVLGIDQAALALDRSAHLEHLARLLNQTAMSNETRSTLLSRLEEIVDPIVAGAIGELADDDDCSLAMEAALSLERRGDPSRLPRRERTRDEDDARRALCLAMHDDDSTRQRNLLAEFVGKGGVAVSRKIDGDTYYDGADAGPDDEEAEPDAGPVAVTDLDEIETLIRETIEFENTDPSWAKRELSFDDAPDGGLHIGDVEIYEFHGCGC